MVGLISGGNSQLICLLRILRILVYGADHFFHHVVETIDGIPYIQFMEIFMIAIPILLHAIYGIIIWWQGS